MKKWLCGFLCIFCFLLCGSAAAEGFSITYQASESADTIIHTSLVDGQTYLFLPSSAQADNLVLTVDADCTFTATGEDGLSLTFASGKAWDLTSLFTAEPIGGQYNVTITAENGYAKNVTIMFSANIRSIYLVSNDPENEGREWLEDCDDHSRYTSGRTVILRADGTTVYDGGMKKIRGRGNSTWTKTDPDGTDDKRPYQITLTKEVDLLDTGDPREANKRWVLLAEYFDPTMLHNRISFDMALELGQTETSHSEPVDLYYDGEYRGTYLLTEKVEVGTGRVEVEDYEDILEAMNKTIGVDITALAQIGALSDAGTALYATEGVFDGGNPSLGGYLLEMDDTHYQGSQSYFILTSSELFVVKNPEFASLGIVRYLGDIFEELGATLRNYGLSPNTGLSWSDYFGAESILPYYWIHELSKCKATWNQQSYFVIPEGGGSKVRMGPVWDFDKAYYLVSDEDGNTDDPTGITESGSSDWGYLLLRIPEFQSLAKQYFIEELEPIVRDILLGDEDAHGQYLHSLVWYWEQESASRAMNDVLWNPIGLYNAVVYPTYQENFDSICSFLAGRINWLAEEIGTWPCYEDAIAAEITLEVPYANGLAMNITTVDDFYNNAYLASLEGSITVAATKTDYATIRADITFAPKPTTALADGFAVTINGTSIPCTKNEDGSATGSFLFEDPSYRIAELGSQDYGLVFNADYYAEHYPEVVTEVGDDPDALLEYYVNYGIADGQVANCFFDPQEVLDKLPSIEEMLGDDYETVCFFFLEAGYVDWMNHIGKTFKPEIRNAD